MARQINVRVIEWTAYLLLGTIVFPGQIFAATCTSVSSGNWNVTSSWSCGTVPNDNDDVIIAGSHTITLDVNSKSLNSLTVNSGATLQGNNAGVTLTIGNGGSTPASFITNNGSINFSGAQSATLRLGANSLWDGSAAAGWNLTSLDLGGFALTFPPAASFTINLSGEPAIINVGSINAAPFNSTVTFNFNGAAQTVPVSGIFYPNLTLSGSGIKTIATGTSQTLNIQGNLKVQAGATYWGAPWNPMVNLRGNFENNGTFQSGTQAFRFNGSKPQEITGTAPGPSGTTIFVISLGNPAGLTLIGSHNVTVSGGLYIPLGRLKTGNNVLIISSGNAIVQAGPKTFVVGNLQKRFTAGTSVSRTFELGTEPGGVPRYAPVVVTLGDVDTAGNLQVSSTSGDHPNIGSSSLDATRSVNRYWTLTTVSPLALNSSSDNSISFTYDNPGDFNGEPVTASTFLVSRFSPALPGAGAWTEITPANAPPTTTISGSGVPSASINGDYQIANAKVVQAYYIHADHLNTPRLITNSTGQAVWQWDNTDPFGTNAPNENPSSLGNFTCNLRFPGQYFDKETNLHYNYFRDYDPAIGRYIQSDPIGLEGGINTFAYVGSNPLGGADPMGLEKPGQVWNGTRWVYPPGSIWAPSTPTQYCATAECAAGVLPKQPQDPCERECLTDPHKLACIALGVGTSLGSRGRVPGPVLSVPCTAITFSQCVEECRERKKVKACYGHDFTPAR